MTLRNEAPLIEDEAEQMSPMGAAPPIPLTEYDRILHRPPTPIEILEAQDLRATDFRCTDAGNANLLDRIHIEDLRYDHRRGRWLLWTGHRWAPDAREKVNLLATQAAELRYQWAGTLPEDDPNRKEHRTWAVKSENRQRIEAALALARSYPNLADLGDRWDTDPFLLGVPNGVVDLRTGRLRDGWPADRITMQAGAAFDPDAECPRFEQFLEEVFEDAMLIDFIYRAFGYTLTGYVREQAIFICYGRGCNGKSRLLNAVNHALGDYGADTPFATLELSGRAAIPNDLAALVGKRLVTASETGEDRRLNEARIKSLTGGDPITARFLFGEYFTFQPAAKLWLGVNHRPRVKDDSPGFWRRIRLIPFNRSFEGREEKDLDQILQAEAPGILAWLVRGCLAWQEYGLDPPDAVRLATAGYREESDPLATFIASKCDVDPEATARARDLADAYKKWADAEGLSERERLTTTALGRLLTERYPGKKKTYAGWMYHGIGVQIDV